MRVVSFIIFTLLAVNLFAQNAKVKFIIGEVKVKQISDVETWNNLTLNSELKEKDVIRTGAKSLCEIILPDGSVTKILENSTLELSHLKSSTTDSGIELFARVGKFFFSIKKMMSTSFKIKSPVAVMAVRGTEFLVVSQSGKTEVLVKSGKIDFSDLNQVNIVRINAGQKSALRAGMAPELPVPLTEEDLKILDEISASPEKSKPDTDKQEKDIKAEIIPPEPSPPSETEKPTPDVKDDGGFRAGVSFGAVTIDNQIYNQIGIRPEFSIGKLGVCLDFSIYIDKDGNIRDDNWDSVNDIFEKIYYVRWGLKGDPFYAKAGAVDNYRLGFGLLVNHYSNTIQYPDVIRTGLELGMQGEKTGFDVMLNNFSELTDGGGLIAGRLSYKILGDLQIGASVVYDRNQYKALPDKDGDGIPDYIDDFPDDSDFNRDTDGDGVPDGVDPDIDGDGYTDNSQIDTIVNNDPDGCILKPEPFNIDKAKDKSQIAFAVDASYPLINFDYLKLTAYSQFAKFGNDGGWGVTAPGFLAKFAFIDMFAEYRIFDKKFIPEYFNITYELERAVFRADSSGQSVPFTKRQLLESIDEQLTGYVVGADFNLFDFMVFGAEYQNMSKKEIEFKTFRAKLDLNTSFVPKINKAGAYYSQNNADDLFKRTEGTILGYRLEYEISANASLLFDFRQTYRDLNGDGEISGSDEILKTTNIQTVIRF
jgi:hypothetical protein